MKQNEMILKSALADFIYYANLEFLALRLWYGLMYAMQHAILSGAKDDKFEFRISLLRATILPAGEKDSRQVRKAVESLRSSCFVKQIEITENGRSIKLVPTKDVLDIAEEPPHTFSQIDMGMIAKCGSVYEIYFTELVFRHHRKAFPKFDLDMVVGHHKDTRPHWIKAAAKLSERFGYTFVLAQIYEPFSGKHIRTMVKIRHKATRWGNRQFYAFPPSSRIFECTVGKASQLDQRGLQAHLRGKENEDTCGGQAL